MTSFVRSFHVSAGQDAVILQPIAHSTGKPVSSISLEYGTGRIRVDSIATKISQSTVDSFPSFGLVGKHGQVI